MTDEHVFEGKDLGEALAEAAAAMGIPGDDLRYEIVEQGRRGVFGLGAKTVQIRVLATAGQAPPPRRADAPAAEPAMPPAPEAADRAREWVPPPGAADVERTVGRVIGLMGLDLQVQVGPARDGIELQLLGPDRKLLTSRNAELLSALRLLVARMGRRSWPEVGRILVACEGQTARRRDDELIEQIRGVAQQVARTGRTQKLQPMNAYERRLVHLTVREFAGLTSCSDGDGTLKRVRISKVQNLDLGTRP